LKFIESKPGNADSKGSKSIEAKSSPSSSDTAQKSKRSRRTDRKSKRSRTPSVTALSSKEKSPEIHSQSQSRASSVACASKSNPSAMPNNVQDSGLVAPQVQAMDSVTTVKHSLIVVNSPLPNPTPAQVNSSNHKKTLKKPKKQAGWLVDLSNNEPTSKVRLKSKPPSGKNNAAAAGVGGPLTAEPLEQEVSNVTEQEIDSSEEPSSIQDEILNLEDEITSATEVEIDQKPVKSNEISLQQREVTTTATATPTPPPSPSTTPTTTPPTINNKIVQQDLCFNYASILKFVKREWNVVTKEISNGSNDIQSKVVCYKAREKI